MFCPNKSLEKFAMELNVHEDNVEDCTGGIKTVAFQTILSLVLKLQVTI
jgi:hypothetical protein